MSIFARLFKVGQAQAHNIVDKLEDPIKLTEQGIRDLKRDLQGAMQGLAEVKGIAIRLGKESEEASGTPKSTNARPCCFCSAAPTGRWTLRRRNDWRRRP